MRRGNPQSFNRYSYVSNDPVNLSDASGLDPYEGFWPPPTWHAYPGYGGSMWPVWSGGGYNCGVALSYSPVYGAFICYGQPYSPAPPNPAPITITNCSFPLYANLSAEQRALLEPLGGINAYYGLTDTQSASFLNITSALAASGVGLSGLSLQGGVQGIQQDRLLFAPGTTGLLSKVFEPRSTLVRQFLTLLGKPITPA